MIKTDTVSPLCQRMIEDMAGRKLNPHTQRGHIYSAAEIDRLIEGALRLRPQGGLRLWTYATLIALLSATE
jgi:hypothetical protein